MLKAKERLVPTTLRSRKGHWKLIGEEGVSFVAETSTSELHDVGYALRKILLPPTSAFSAPCGILAAARLAKGLHFERAPVDQRGSSEDCAVERSD